FHRATTHATNTPTTIDSAMARADICPETRRGRMLLGLVKISTKLLIVYSGGRICTVHVPSTVNARRTMVATGAMRMTMMSNEPAPAASFSQNPCTGVGIWGVPLEALRVVRRFWYQRISRRKRMETIDRTVDCAAASS